MGRDRAVPYLKNDSAGDFQHSKQFKFEEKYLSKHSNIHKGKQTDVTKTRRESGNECTAVIPIRIQNRLFNTA